MGRFKQGAERLRLGWRLRGKRWDRLSAPLSRSVCGEPLLDRLFQLLDLAMVFDVYESLGLLLFRHQRPLTAREHHLLLRMFGNSLPYGCIMIDERAHVGPRTGRFFYVSFHAINSWGRMPDDILVHEAVHIWQYVHRGAVYIPRALAAQNTEAGYNYGGIAGLSAATSIDDFNYEQVADLVADAYRLAEGYSPRWLESKDPEKLLLFQQFLGAFRSVMLPSAY